MLRIILPALLALWPAMTAAQSCGTRDLISELSSERLAELQALTEVRPYPEGNLYRAEAPGSSVTVVGTLHLPDPRHAETVEAVRSAITGADLLILEATSEAQKDIQAMTANQPELFFLTEGPTLIDLLSEDEWARLTNELAAYGIPGFMASKFQPWFLGMTLAIPPCALTAVQQGERGLDGLLEKVARDAGTPIAELDDIEALMALLSSDPLERQIEGLRMWLDMKVDGSAEITTMVERYFQGKAREAVEFSRLLLEERNIPIAMFDDMMQSILEDRNAAWEPMIIEWVAGKDAVLAVGAAHLSGESGVLRALERAGYTITRL
ncbi:MAG: TraB/GumN family protein [Pseudomonadota bacterium]